MPSRRKRISNGRGLFPVPCLAPKLDGNALLTVQ